MLPFFSLAAPGAALEKRRQRLDERIDLLLSSLTWSIVAAPTTATILPALARASRTGAGRAAALVEALLREQELLKVERIEGESERRSRGARA